MKELIKDRLIALRTTMRHAGIDAYLIYGTDPHLSEYVPARWQTRPFISGFTGSAGMVIVSLHKAALWTDSRYFLQAENQLSGTGIELMKMRTPGYPDAVQWLRHNLTQGATVGTDEWCISVNQFARLKNDLEGSGIKLQNTGDLTADIWPDRPALPLNPVYEHELAYAGRSRADKKAAICAELEHLGANLQIITALDDLAWTFNLRGSDVDYNPVFVAWASISAAQTTLFADRRKLSGELQQKLEAEGIRMEDYSSLTEHLNKLPHGTRLLIDADRTSQAIVNHLPDHCIRVEGLSVPCRLKALKSREEINHIREAMRKDGVAMVEFLYWIKQNIGKLPMTEYTVAEKLNELRSVQPGFKGISFYPIVGYKEHGAIVHLHVTEDDALPIAADGFLLFDSGGQYLDGTTDVTRTIALAPLTERQKTDFTVVLKGMIALTLAKFPVNTRGYHLDILARKDMWKHGLNYGHGTGHGVGYFLNVHEGPMAIRQELNDRPMEAGMVLSNEPALYRQGEYGLRTENMMVCVEDESTEFGNFLSFDTLTLCPIDIQAIESGLLSPEEKNWLNDYHQQVYNELAPRLSDELKAFLFDLTRPVGD